MNTWFPPTAALVAGLILFSSFPARGAVIRVGDGPGCDYSSLQAALDAAAASPGPDSLRVRMGSFAAQRLTVTDADDVSIEGGFVDCQTDDRDGRTELSGLGADPPGPVITHTGAGWLTLVDLVVRKGNAANAASTHSRGGGVLSSGGHLTIVRTSFFDNEAIDGGGLAVLGSPGKNVFLQGVDFSGNIAALSGGAIHLQEAELQIRGGDPVWFSHNQARGTGIDEGGGAIYALDASVLMQAAVPDDRPFMQDNFAVSHGGAIMMVSRNRSYMWGWFSADNGRAGITFARNIAWATGGTFEVQATNTGAGELALRMANAVITDSNAPEGSTLHVRAAGSGQPVVAEVGFVASDPFQAQCPPAQRCNRVSGSSGAGAVIRLEQAGSGQARFVMERGYLLDNASRGGVGLVAGEGEFELRNVVIAGNDTRMAPLFVYTGRLLLSDVTLADNVDVAPSVVRSTGIGDVTTLYNSILFQPGVPIRSTEFVSALNTRNLLVGSGHGLGNLDTRNIVVTGDPRFVDPAGRDYELQADSPAVNRWAPGGGVLATEMDLPGRVRPAAGGGDTPYDFGAFEYGAVVDPIFSDGFDPVTGRSGTGPAGKAGR